jgi:hypothetical protein
LPLCIDEGVNAARLAVWRRQAPVKADIDPTLVVIPYAALSRDTVELCGAATAVALVALARHPLPSHGVPLAAVYLVVNAGYAFRGTSRDLGGIQLATRFVSGRPVRVTEPAPLWSGLWLFALLFVAWAYFVSTASAGRFLLASSLPGIAQALITHRAITRRERTGVELYLGGGQIYVHPRVEPLP